MHAGRDQEWNSDDGDANEGVRGVADTDICRDSRAYDRAGDLANNCASGASDRAPDAAPTLAPLNLSPVLERAARLSAAKAAKAIFTVNINMFGFLALGSVAGRLDAAEQPKLAATRGSPPPGFGAERVAFDACRTTPRVTVMGDLLAAIGSETTYSRGIGPSGQSDGLSFGRFNEEFAMSRIRV